MSYKIAITDIKTNSLDLIIEEDEAQDFLVVTTGGEFTDSVKSDDIDGFMYSYLLELFLSDTNNALNKKSKEKLLEVIEAEVKKLHRPSTYYKFTPQDLATIYMNLTVIG